MTLRQGVEIKLTGDPTKELRFLLGPGGLPRGYPWRGYDGPEAQGKELYRGWCTNAGRDQPRGPRAAEFPHGDKVRQRRRPPEDREQRGRAQHSAQNPI